MCVLVTDITGDNNHSLYWSEIGTSIERQTVFINRYHVIAVWSQGIFWSLICPSSQITVWVLHNCIFLFVTSLSVYLNYMTFVTSVTFSAHLCPTRVLLHVFVTFSLCDSDLNASPLLSLPFGFFQSPAFLRSSTPPYLFRVQKSS